MISTPDRQHAVELIQEAIAAGARCCRACQELSLSVRTFRRWRTPEGLKSDGRPFAKRPSPANRLSDEERADVLKICHEPRFASLPPGQIVPRLADEGRYMASESTFYRVLRSAGKQHHRGRARQPVRRQPSTHQARAPHQVWTWDITWMPGPITGRFFYLYLILDIFSRMIVGWEVHEREGSDLAARLVEQTVWAEGCILKPLVLHADNGSPMKGATMKATLEKLGVTPSYSRPRVSNDNPFSEALFRTCKYRPEWPKRGFATRADAQAWVKAFVTWYNEEHMHSAIGFVPPALRHRGQDAAILQSRRELYKQARDANPQRWSGRIRSWASPKAVWLNPETSTKAMGAPARAPHAGEGDPMAGRDAA
jgi:transposase InsO family protein